MVPWPSPGSLQVLTSALFSERTLSSTIRFANADLERHYVIRLLVERLQKHTSMICMRKGIHTMALLRGRSSQSRAVHTYASGLRLVFDTPSTRRRALKQLSPLPIWSMSTSWSSHVSQSGTNYNQARFCQASYLCCFWLPSTLNLPFTQGGLTSHASLFVKASAIRLSRSCAQKHFRRCCCAPSFSLTLSLHHVGPEICLGFDLILDTFSSGPFLSFSPDLVTFALDSFLGGICEACSEQYSYWGLGGSLVVKPTTSN